MTRWGADGPPPEAYSRVSDPERFRGLHKTALELLERLEATFDVDRFESYGLDEELEFGDLARPSTRLVPRDPSAAPLVIAFTAFPGVRLRAGRWRTDAFPVCGCDACDEQPEEEAARLAELTDDVTSGRFCEEMLLPQGGEGQVASESWSPRHRSSHRISVDRARAREMLTGSDQLSLKWRPWPRRYE